MFEPFVWIFKQENWKQNAKFLCLVPFGFLIIFLLLYFAGTMLCLHNAVAQWSLCLLALLILFSALLLVQGYFWELVENIIFRGTDIVASDIYNGKIKQVYKIDLPELKVFKLIWRGLASIVATILMCLPAVLLIFTSAITLEYTTVNVFTVAGYSFGTIGICILVFIFTPALLWNYAKQNSVVAVWNIRKAIYIIGNYTGKYLLNSLIFFLFYAAQELFMVLLAKLLLFGTFDVNSIGIFQVVRIGLFALISYFMMLYSLYVYAYLLGTIAPSDEA